MQRKVGGGGDGDGDEVIGRLDELSVAGFSALKKT